MRSEIVDTPPSSSHSPPAPSDVTQTIPSDTRQQVNLDLGRVDMQDIHYLAKNGGTATNGVPAIFPVATVNQPGRLAARRTRRRGLTKWGRRLSPAKLASSASNVPLKKNKLENKKITEETYNTWKTKHDADGSCGSNYEGPSGGMEVEAARRLFARSRDLKFEYENLVSDGDANSYKAVLAMNNGNGPYQDTKVTKLECINHVQKRLGTRLRKLREQEKVDTITKTGSKIRRSLLGGRNKLTDTAIDKMQSFFGKHIRDNVGADYITMKKAVMSSFHHIFSTDEKPRHGLCEEGINSWCFFQKALAEGKNREEIKHKKSLVVNLDQEAQNKIRQVYDALTTKDILERCVRGLTQNANESFHSKINQGLGAAHVTRTSITGGRRHRDRRRRRRLLITATSSEIRVGYRRINVNNFWVVERLKRMKIKKQGRFLDTAAHAGTPAVRRR
ncbi:hypothetical protein O3P69_007862 [Scylla paramamosain]|uniref:Mutator-like transposase domain-containing protein n=1 Tax=Scylla paramamosain TaxID=85552 RepID=A0AAW0SJ95_SCYPA